MNNRNFNRRFLNKKIILPLAFATAALSAAPGYAFELETEQKQSATVLTSTVAGTAIGGPVGFVVGLFGGIWASEQVAAADQAEGLAMELEQQQSKLASLQQQLNNRKMELASAQQQLQQARDKSAQYAQIVMEQLQLEMMFKTGEFDLTREGKRRLLVLGQFLNDNPKIQVRLDGYTDPRGDASYNLQLSRARVDSVLAELEQAGVDVARVIAESHGASQSQAIQGDYDGYAMERVVRIELSQGEQELASADLRMGE